MYGIGLTLKPAWIFNYIHDTECGMKSHIHSQTSNVKAIEVLELISNFIKNLTVHAGIKLVMLVKVFPWVTTVVCARYEDHLNEFEPVIIL